MTDAVQALQNAAVAALGAHPVLAQSLTGIFDGPPARAAYPFISITDGVSSDWSTKTETGREIRFAFTIWDDGEEALRLHNLMGHAEEAMAAIADEFSGWKIASNIFLRSFVVRDAAGPWAGLLEHRFRILSQ